MKRVVFIGQAPAKSGSKNAVAGSYLHPWLHKLGFDDMQINEYFRFYALIDDFPGSDKTGHLRPTDEQLQKHKPVLIREVKEFQPNIIVPVGAMAITEFLPEALGNLSDIIGNIYSINPYDCLDSPVEAIPLPHPSGRSTWINKNSDLLIHALTQLDASIDAPQ